MKTRPIKHGSEAGNVLFTTVILAAILGITLAGYLLWVQSQNVNVAESQAWNGALSVAEAGIEEGMAQVNVMEGTLYPTNYFPSIVTNFGALAGGVYGPRTNALVSGNYSVIVLPGNPGPTIISTGYAAVPYVGQQIARVVKVTTATAPLFGNSIAALQNVDFKGNTITIDSFDSSDPLHSTNGQYNAATRKAGGDVASTGGLINVGNGNIFGHLRLAPGSAYSLGPNGAVGDLPANWPAQSGVETGWLFSDYNQSWPDVNVPYTSGPGMPAAKGASSTINLGASSYYISGDYTMQNGDILMVDGANANLYVTGSFNMKNGSTIVVTNGGSLKVFIGASSGAATSGSFTQVNVNGNSSTFQIYGLPSTTSLSWNGNASYAGTVYAPEAAFSLGGGGSTPYDYQGALVVGSVSLNGHFSVHYDEYLKRGGPASGYTVASWQEL
jgi:hypothetical protein